jgi:4-hydroxybenzoyl-CoA reductase subunit beta
MLKEYKDQAKVIAGGTDLLVSIKQRVITPQYLINLKEIPDLNYIKQNGKEIKIGILTLMSDLESSSVIKEHFSILAEAASVVASPLLRNMGTIGGNICLNTRCCYYNQSEFFRKSIEVCFKFGGEVCHVVKKGKRCYAVSQADTVPALIALRAKVKVESADGEKIIPVEELYNDDGKDYINLKAEEIITEVQIPTPSPNTGGSYKKLASRKSIDFPFAGAAVNLSLKDGLCEDIRVVLSAVGSSPVRVVKAEEVLRGKTITDELIEEASEFSSKEAKPFANVVGVTAPYRKAMARVMTKRATKEALSMVKL